jgi:exosortase D (VPLPA-CTERM-specific)
MSVVAKDAAIRFETPRTVWLLLGAAALLGVLAFHDGLARMVAAWFGSEEYSHGVLIPVIVAVLVWQRRRELERDELRGSWLGVAAVAVAVLVYLAGSLATLYVVQQLGALAVLYGVILAAIGWPAMRRLWAPLLMLVLMIPLPQFLLQDLSARLQLVSSEIGVAIMRLAGVSVLLEGNVIDLGSYKLEVAEACSGLRYLFPLMTLGFVMAYLFQAPLWKRLVVFLASVPVTILMNSLRIGLVGVTVDRWGTGAAEGALHDFEGWILFMASTAVLVGIVVALNRMGYTRRPWRESFGLEWARGPQPVVPGRKRPLSRPLVVCVVLLAASAVGLAAMPQRSPLAPERQSFATFPSYVDAWQGRRALMEQVYVDALKFDDYLLADFARESRQPINLYIAWYGAQAAGQSAHSPRSCIPGGGWRILSLAERQLPGAASGGRSLRVNRAVIAHGENRQLVYYWFEQRGRVVTSEYAVKWWIFWDALTRNRSDGALVRLVTRLAPQADERTADAELAEFAQALQSRLAPYVPD